MTEYQIDRNLAQSRIDSIFQFDGGMRMDPAGAHVRDKISTVVLTDIQKYPAEKQQEIIDRAASLNAPFDGWLQRDRIPLPAPSTRPDISDFAQYRAQYRDALLGLEYKLRNKDGIFDAEAFKLWVTGRAFKTIDDKDPSEFNKLVNLVFLVQKLHPEIVQNGADIIADMESYIVISAHNLHSFPNLNNETQAKITELSEAKKKALLTRYKHGTVLGENAPLSLGAIGLMSSVEGMLADVSMASEKQKNAFK